MAQKLTFSQIAERFLYLLAALFTPSIPLFFLYSRNAAQGLLFRHFLIFGGTLAILSLILYFLISKFALRRRRTVILIALLWAAFWFFGLFQKIITGIGFSQNTNVVILLVLVFIAAAGFILRYVNMSRLVANTVAILLCLLFAFNFVPAALAVSAGEIQRAENTRSGVLPYEVKTAFNVDTNLPRPNVYWLHMDGLMGFDAVERYFNDPQTELENELAQRGFVVNRSARLEAGGTHLAVAPMTSPTFYDSYLADEFAKVAKLISSPRHNSIHAAMAAKGFSLYDIYPQTEILKAFSDAGYINIGTPNRVQFPMLVNIGIVGTDVTDFALYNRLINFRNHIFIKLIVDASALSIFKEKTDEWINNIEVAENMQPIPDYREAVNKYLSGSDSDDHIEEMVRGLKYAASVQTPHFVYFANYMAHCLAINDTKIGEVDYGEFIGRVFIYDENGNVYKKRLVDPHDVSLYFPQHKYALKEMMAQVDTIIENDPGAVIILQADHGIHGIGNGTDYFDSGFMFDRGYSLEDQLNLNLQVFSAVRVPPQYGSLTHPLDPLDISRWLVNHFVGEGNYKYLYYNEED